MLGACGQAAPGTAVSSAPAKAADSGSPQQQAQWDALVAAAKQEGKLAAVVNPPVDVYRPLYESFQSTFGIQVEELPLGGRPDLVSRIGSERSAGQFLWDVVVHSPGTLFDAAKPIGALDPLPPALFLPDAIDDSKWRGGFGAGWYDLDKSLAYSFVGYVYWTAYVNRQLVPQEQLSKIDQLWDPKWKGKIAIQDPRASGAGSSALAVWLAAKGEDKLRQFLTDQQPVPTLDKRQLAEWVLRGNYPIAIGISESQMSELERQGLDISQVQPISDTDKAAAGLSAGSGAVGLINRAPHPNAAKLFANWLLTHDAQALYAKQTGFNVRRTDVAPVSPRQVPEAGREYVNVETEQSVATFRKAIDVSKELLK
ncbi:MAG TPA: extracellular solute-binding protein [Chloroflexota bacterium]|nr:extracellular solute-binding protein [Chloroflexota bacterium]